MVGSQSPSGADCCEKLGAAAVGEVARGVEVEATVEAEGLEIRAKAGLCLD